MKLLEQLRAQRGSTIRALSAITGAQLTAHVGPDRPVNVRFTLLSLAQDDDRRCALLGSIFAQASWEPSEAQRILASLALTRGQLRAALIGLTNEQADESPGPDEWAMRQILRHIMNNENQFVVDSKYAVERLRSTEPLPLERPGERNGPGTLGPELAGGVEEILRTLDRVRDDLVAWCAGLTVDELAAPMPWAGLTTDVRFMLHRRATHEREHTVQVYKTSRGIGFQPSEAQMILGQAEIARAALEGTILGIPEYVAGIIQSLGEGQNLSHLQKGSSELISASEQAAQLLEEARAEEEAKVAVILRAVE